MNRQQLTYVRVVALLMAGLVATLAFCNLFTIATKGISVYLPTEKDVHWSVDPLQKEILFRTKFSIKNQGVYDIRDIGISAQLLKDETRPLFTFEKKDMVVLRGSNTTFDLIIPINLDTIPLLDWFSLIYQKSTLQLRLDVDALYMFGLIEFTANEEIDIPWAPPILNLSDNDTVQQGIKGLSTLLNIRQNHSLSSLTDLASLFSLPEFMYTSDNGFLFSLNTSFYSDFVRNITCHVVVPLFFTNASFAFTVSFLIGFNDEGFLFQIEEARVQYVNE
jgi:hypothetical protein